MFNQLDPAQSGETIAIIKTSHGEMRARLFPEIIGEAAENFMELAKQGKYNNAPFHRIIKGFMIQGGDFTNRNGTGGHAASGPGSHIGDKYNASLTHLRGALSWAKTAMPNSIGSQFFIVHPEEGTHFLDHPAKGGPAEGYTVFGQLFDGFDVLDTIAKVKVDRNDRPLEDVTIESITIEAVA
jgi:cyclophilin family peptidyl-prolyl cis-trans isomerase